MTSVSQTSQIPSQASNSTNASQQQQQQQQQQPPTLSYASTAKKAVSSPVPATSSSTPSPAVAVGGAGPVQHGKSSSISPLNGKPMTIAPAVPAVAAPAIAHSSSATNGSSEHARKTSVTIGANGMNGGPVGGMKIQFGSVPESSPKVSHSTTTEGAPNATSSAPIAIPNPRITDPSHSPSPIPAPSASGGKPPSGLQGNNPPMAFGSFESQRRTPSTHGALAPTTHPAGHHRHESAQSAQSDMSNHAGNAGRGGFSGRGGRGGGSSNFTPAAAAAAGAGYPPQLGYAPQSNFRPAGNPPRGAMAPSFPGRGFPNSPHQASRSPNLAHSIPGGSMPGTPNMNPAMPMANQPPYGYYAPMPQQVPHPPSFNTLPPPPPPPSPFKSHSRGKRGKLNSARFGKNEQSSERHWPRGSLEKAFSHDYTTDEHKLPVRGQQVHLDGSGLPSLPPFPQGPQGGNRRSRDPMPLSIYEPLGPPNLDPATGNFDRIVHCLREQQQQYPVYSQQFGNDARMSMGQASFGYPQMAHMQGFPPSSPQPHFHQPTSYTQGLYSNGGQSMSRNGSQMSERPASSTGQPQTPSMVPIAHAHTPQPKPGPTSPAFSRPARKSAAIVIKRPDGEAVDVGSFKAPASPAPSQRARTPPVIASTPTPPPPKSATPQQGRIDSAAPQKTSEQIRLEMFEKVKKAKEEDEAKEAAEAKSKEEQKAKDEAQAAQEQKAKDAAQAAQEQKAKEAADAQAAADKAKKDEEDELERQIQEMEAAEAEREKKEAELLAKRAAEKKAAEAANAEKRKAEAAANDLKLKEQEREMERLEDEKEKKRQEADAKAAAAAAAADKPAEKEDSKPEPNTPSTLASKLSNLALGTDSGASTPESDGSMGPPPKINISEKRGKPAALNLAPLHTKPVEAPQPSAALQSLKSARFLTVMNSSLYPPSISSPNPALNSAVTTKGKSFKYDKEFLLQFQKVFVEKPSMEFESQIKALIGDGDSGSSRQGSARPGGNSMGPRQGSSRNNQPGAFAMGSFGSVGGKTLPPGTTSAERFAMASGSMPRPAPTSTASFTRAGGAGFPGGNQMVRNMSNPMNNIPHSPRQASRSQRGGGGSRKDTFPGNAKSEAQAAKTMPLTAGMELKPIAVTATGWKPRIAQQASATGAAGPTPGSSGATGHMEPDMVQRKVKAALNKMTPEKFDKIADQVLAIAAQSKDEADGRTLRQVIQLTFEKATDEAHWASMYAKFCKRMLETMSPEIKDESIVDKNGNIVSGGNLFRKYLLNRCQEEFERGWKMDLPDKPEGEPDDPKTEEAAMLSDEYYIAAAAKRRGLGLVQFIGELYKLSMLTERIMHECVKKLVDYTGIPDEAEIESLTKLLKTIGSNLDSTEKGKPMMDVYFQRIQTMVDTPELPSRLRFMLMDIIDLRKARWASKDNNKGPKTLDEVRIEAEAAANQKAAENNARGSQRGGRMQMGRGDGRNFSGNQYGQPPIDYQKNVVGMDDLRRLTNKNANRASSQQMSFGPSSMFSSRSNSGRKGPGNFGRAGEESGASSRTGTPPQQKEKESTSSANTFSLLAGLGSGDQEAPGSPPSTSVSPAMTKSTPASADKSGDKESEA